jgi:hypothetical protein
MVGDEFLPECTQLTFQKCKPSSLKCEPEYYQVICHSRLVLWHLKSYQELPGLKMLAIHHLKTYKTAQLDPSLKNMVGVAVTLCTTLIKPVS